MALPLWLREQLGLEGQRLQQEASLAQAGTPQVGAQITYPEAPTHAPGTDPITEETEFQRWYAQMAGAFQLPNSPHDPDHEYNWRLAFRAGYQPDQQGQLPDQFRLDYEEPEPRKGILPRWFRVENAMEDPSGRDLMAYQYNKDFQEQTLGVDPELYEDKAVEYKLKDVNRASDQAIERWLAQQYAAGEQERQAAMAQQEAVSRQQRAVTSLGIPQLQQVAEPPTPTRFGPGPLGIWAQTAENIQQDIAGLPSGVSRMAQALGRSLTQREAELVAGGGRMVEAAGRGLAGEPTGPPPEVVLPHMQIGMPGGALQETARAVGGGIIAPMGEEIQQYGETSANFWRKVWGEPELAGDWWENFKRNPIDTLAVSGMGQTHTMVNMIGAAAVGGPVAGLGAGFLQEGIGAHEECVGAGGSPEDCLRMAGQVGAGNMVLEYWPAGRLIRKVFRGVPERELSQRLGEVIKQAGFEAGTESVQELNGILHAYAFAEGDKELTLEDLTWENVQAGAKRIAEAAGTGLVLGGGMAAPTLAMPYAPPPVEEAEVQEEPVEPPPVEQPPSAPPTAPPSPPAPLPTEPARRPGEPQAAPTPAPEPVPEPEPEPVPPEPEPTPEPEPQPEPVPVWPPGQEPSDIALEAAAEPTAVTPQPGRATQQPITLPEAPQRDLYPQATEATTDVGNARKGDGYAAVSNDPPNPMPPDTPVGRRRHNALDIPEMVELVQILARGDIPIRVRKELKKKATLMGYFSGDLPFHIGVRADLPTTPATGERSRELELSRAHTTLAHEIGHWIDALAGTEDEVGVSLPLGNIIRNLTGLKDYIKDTITLEATDPREFLEPNVIKQLLIDSIAEARAIGPMANAGAIHAAKLKQAALDRGMIDFVTLKNELKDLSRQWRGDWVNAPPKHQKYRELEYELQADFFSALLNDPEWAQEVAPYATEIFFNYLHTKPEANRAYLGLLSKASEGRTARMDNRWQRYQAMINEGLRKREEQAESEQTTWQSIKTWVRDYFKDLNSPLVRRWDTWQKLATKARERGMPIPELKNPIVGIEETPYKHGEAFVYVADFKTKVLQPVEAAGISLEELSGYIGLRRAVTERKDMWNPLGIQGEAAVGLVEHVREGFGEEAAKILDEALARWWVDRKIAVVERGTKAGLWDAATAERMRNNPNYVRYQVQTFIDEAAESDSAMGVAMRALKEQVGTLQEIGDPLRETMLTDLAIMRLAHRNETAQELVRFMEVSSPGDLIRPRTVFRRAPAPPKGFDTVYYLENGRTKAAQMPAEVARSVNHHFEYGVGLKFWRKWISDPVRVLLVERNLAFALLNGIRDPIGTWKQVVPGNPVSSALKLGYHMFRPEVRKAAWRLVNKHELTPITRDMLRAGAILPPGVVGRGRAAGFTEEELQKQFFVEWGVLTPARGKWKENLVSKIILTVFSDKPSQFSERWSKIAVWSLQEAAQAREHKTAAQASLAGETYTAELQSVRERAQDVRRLAGTPDMMRRGLGHPWLNNAFLFSNVNKEGYRSAWEGVKRDPGNYILKTMTYALVPKAVQLLLEHGYLGGDEDWWERVPAYDKRNYMIIPVGTDDYGRAAYFKIPLDHQSALASNVMYEWFDNDKEAGEKIFDVIIDALPWGPEHAHPAIKVGLASHSYLRGNNPFDDYWGSNVVQPSVWQGAAAGVPEDIKEKRKQVAKWTWNNLGGRILWKFQRTPRNPREAEAWISRSLNWPIASNVIGSVFKVTDAGLYDEANRRAREVEDPKLRISRQRTHMLNIAIDADPEVSQRDATILLRETGLMYKRPGDLKRRLTYLKCMRSPNPIVRRGCRTRDKEAAAELDEMLQEFGYDEFGEYQP